jgi:phosphoribosyl-AMP cyclohydrolase
LQQSAHEHVFLWHGVAFLTDPVLTTAAREGGLVFAPKFDAAGLLTAVVVDAAEGDVLVVANMNRAALEATFATGKVHFWSRSRGTLWMKGETSGNVLNVVAMLVDCDQDALLIRAAPTGPTCHTGARSCFYRKLVMGDDGPALAHTDA